MKNDKRIDIVNPLFALGVVVVAIFIVFLLSPMNINKQPKAGEVWVEINGDEDNPFEKPDTIYYNVLNVKDKYVLYTIQGHREHDYSCKRYIFVYDKNLLKNK
jgi:hypothetical protein